MSTETSTSTTELHDRLTDLQRDVEELARTVKAIVREKFDEASDSAAGFCEERRAKARDIERSIENCIAEKPFSALLTAAGAGLLIGLIWRRH